MTKRRIDTGPALGDLVEAAKGLAHPARLRLLGMLTSGELCVCQMIAVLGLAPSTVSKHLSVLAHGGLVAERKEGKLVFYRLREDGPAGALLPPLLSLLAAVPDSRADRTVIARLRQVPVAALCAADLDLAAVGVRQSIEKVPLHAS
ncbi:MAG TPA: metalloregulator ArsR/SmtB family transcription factor [Thermoanaerobaculia bacterium]|nr:metalloregulator ArsR/SmtB family transcription factor [Thermoanaerobaculia bacterium]